MTAEPRSSNPFALGLLMLAGLGCLAWLALRLGDWQSPFARHYELTARFVSASGLREGAFVEIAGVRVGSVAAIAFDSARYESVVTLRLIPGFELPADAIASIRTSGLIGDKFVRITPGGAAETLPSGGEIVDTESSINIEELISKYIFESGDQ